MKIQELKENISKITGLRRQYGYLQHKLENITAIAFCATTCDTEDFEDIENWEKSS